MMRPMQGLLLATTVVAAGCFSQASIGPQVTVERIRQVKIGMSRSEVERLLGTPSTVQEGSHFHGTDAELMVYSRRVPIWVMRYPMLWVHLRDGKVDEVYAKQHYVLDSAGVYGNTSSGQWETAEFVKTFPAASGLHP
jgi:SmpA/OmlA family protein